MTGDLIAAGGIAKRLADFAHALTSWMRGGLGLATLGSCGMFAAISGSNSATTATIGGIMHPELEKDGYNSNFAAATAAAGGTVGIIIPLHHFYCLRVRYEPLDFRSFRRGDIARTLDGGVYADRLLVDVPQKQLGNSHSI